MVAKNLIYGLNAVPVALMNTFEGKSNPVSLLERTVIIIKNPRIIGNIVLCP